MAESGSASNDSMTPPTSSSSAAAPADWEVLTMSMSSSAIGKPQGSDPGIASAKSNSQIENPSNPNNGTFSSDVWTAPLHASVNLDSSNDAEAEPFTEGWKPHLSSSGLYGYNGERNGQGEVSLPRDGAETYFDSSAAMEMPEDSFVPKIDNGDTEKRALAHGHIANKIDTSGLVVKEKIKTKGGKQPKKLSMFIWSFALAASVMGIVVLGHRLRVAYHENQHLQIQLSAKDEKLKEMLLQVNRLKEVVGYPRRISVSKN